MKEKDEKIIAMIPARMDSMRLAMKNLALLNGKPLIYYAIQAAKQSRIFNKIVINSEDELFAKIAKRYKVAFYLRPFSLGTSSAKSDSVVFDFIRKNPCGIVVWVNPTSPLQRGEEIKRAVEYFLKKHLDSLITVINEPVHCNYQDRPINYSKKGLFARTQDLIPVQRFVYSVMIWRTETFVKTFKDKGHAIFCGRHAVYPVSKFSSVIIKTKDDFMLAEALLKTVKKEKEYKMKYDKIIKVYIKGNMRK